MMSFFLVVLQMSGLPAVIFIQIYFSLSMLAFHLIHYKEELNTFIYLSRKWEEVEGMSTVILMNSAVSQKASGEVLEVWGVPQLGGLQNSPPRVWVRYERKECNYRLIRNPDSLLQNMKLPFLPQKWNRLYQHLKTNLPAKKWHSPKYPATSD